MKLYDVRLRLNGSLLNEVWLKYVTAAELHVLLRIHGAGTNYPLAEVHESGSVSRSDHKERRRLRDKYHEWGLGNGDKLVQEVLGAPGTLLPQEWVPPEMVADEEFDEDEAIQAMEEEEHIIELAKPVEVMKDQPIRTRVPRKTAPVAA